MSSFEGLRLLLQLGRPLWRHGIAILKKYSIFSDVIFSHFLLVIQTLDSEPDPDPHPGPYRLKMLDPEPAPHLKPMRI